MSTTQSESGATGTSSVAAAFPLSTRRNVADIDAFDDIAGYAKINGREVAVHHLDAVAYAAIEALRVNPTGAKTTDLYDAVERACPELTHEEVYRLSGPKIGALLAIAEQGVKDVEAHIPNAPGPMAETSQDSSPSA